MRQIVLLAVLPAVSSCLGGDNPPSPDSCWWADDEPVEETGRIEIGTGEIGFETLAEGEPELVLERGIQGGHHFLLNARMWELDPGSRDHAEENPHTFFSVYREDGTKISIRPCAYQAEYVEQIDVDGYALRGGGLFIQIEKEQVPVVENERVRVVVELVDKQRRYARDERWIRALPDDSPGPWGPDAAAADAGPPDGGPDDTDDFYGRPAAMPGLGDIR